MIVVVLGQAVSMNRPGCPVECGRAWWCGTVDTLERRNGRLRRSSEDAVCNERTSDQGRLEGGGGCVSSWTAQRFKRMCALMAMVVDGRCCGERLQQQRPLHEPLRRLRHVRAGRMKPKRMVDLEMIWLRSADVGGG